MDGSGECAPAPCRRHSQSQNEGCCPEPWEGQHRAWLRRRGGLEEGVDGDKDHQPNLQPLVHAAVQVPRLCTRLNKKVPDFIAYVSSAVPHMTLSIGHTLGSRATRHTKTGTADPLIALQQPGWCMRSHPEGQGHNASRCQASCQDAEQRLVEHVVRLRCCAEQEVGCLQVAAHVRHTLPPLYFTRTMPGSAQKVCVPCKAGALSGSCQAKNGTLVPCRNDYATLSRAIVARPDSTAWRSTCTGGAHDIVPSVGTALQAQPGRCRGRPARHMLWES